MKAPEPEKPIAHITGDELDRYQRKLEEHHLRAQAGAYDTAQLRKVLRETRRGGGL